MSTTQPQHTNDATGQRDAEPVDVFSSLDLSAKGFSTDTANATKAKRPKPTPSKSKTAKRASNRANKQPVKVQRVNKQAAAKKDALPTQGKGGGIRFQANKESQPVETYGYDLSTVEGRKQRFEAIANNKLSKDADVIRALSSLEGIYKEEAATDPNARLDPADVCAYLARQHLYGLDPAAVLLERFGLRRVAKAIGQALGLAQVSLSLGGQTEEYIDESQQAEGVASDGVSDALLSEAVDAGQAPPRAD